jgi:Ca2+-binding RTX toxin-like protein
MQRVTVWQVALARIRLRGVRDSLTGGAGADVFVLLSAAETGLTAGTRDSITDFVHGVDDMRMIFMASFTTAASFTVVGQVRYNATTGLLTGNTDADAAAEWTVQMATGLSLTSGDFVF